MEGDQSEGGGERDLRSFDITAASSAVTPTKRRERRRSVRVERESRVLR